MRTTITGLALVLISFFAGVTLSAIGSSASVIGSILLVAATVGFVGGIGCLIVGPFLWVRDSRRRKAEELALLREIAAQGRHSA